ncbi:MAG: thiamine-phosphate kinase [Cyanobacteria bacterium REEB459]|nr:thiamine-phosphate kinase [Cyanobacteria bacterium REEB459]
MTAPQTVAEIGELGLLQRLFKYCPAALVGDDAAVLDLPAGQRLVVTTDVLVQGVHFSDRTTGPGDVGWRSVAANLSDLAAMGAAPLGITVGLSLPPTTAISWVEDLYEAMATCLKSWGGVLLGGDLCRSPMISLAITALGSAPSRGIFYRSSAQPGEVILATGYHGLSRAGLALLLSADQHQAVAAGDRQRWVQAHQRPQPRLDVVSWLRRQGWGEGITAMDSSDGLANAVLQICAASGVGASLDADNLPLDPALVEWVGLEQAMDWCLYGGEDFELILCLPRTIAQALQAYLGPESALLGQITREPAVILQSSRQPRHPGIELSLSRGFQHF